VWLRAGSTALAFAVAIAGIAPTGAHAADDRRVRHVTMAFVDRSRPTEDPTGARSAPTRTLVTQVYIPRGKGPFPLIMFAHGNAGHPGKLTQLLSAWASAGYVVVAPTFPLTNDLTEAASIIIDFVNQPADVRYTLDRVLREAKRPRSPLYRRIDSRRIGLAGHSLGGATAYGVAFHPCCRDRRIDAVISMDGVKAPFGDRDFAFRGTPLFLIHLFGDPVVPFSISEGIFAIAAPPKYLMAMKEGIHFEPFEDAPSPHDEAVVAASTAFWNGYLKDRSSARRRIVSAGTVPGLSQVTAVLR